MGGIAITDVRVFDGERELPEATVWFDGPTIRSVAVHVPPGTTVIDGRGATLIPGLIDSHVHTDIAGLRDALKFGITTELEMMGNWSARQRQRISQRNDVADLRSAGMGVTPKGGHPAEYLAAGTSPFLRFFYRFPFVQGPEEAARFVAHQVARGADYIKIFIEDGSCIGFPGLPVLDEPTLRAAVQAAHSHGKLAIVHATTADGTRRAIQAGADGLAHLFVDAPAHDTVPLIVSSGAFIVPTLVTLSSAFGHSAAALAKDERVRSRLSDQWLAALAQSMNVYPAGTLERAYASLRALHEAGVEILAGSDVSEPRPMFGGLAPGASLHHELQLLVAAGLSTQDALRAATSVPARRFGLSDRGRIAPGFLADLVLVDGNPLVQISDTLSVRSVWHRGVELSHRSLP